MPVQEKGTAGVQGELWGARATDWAEHEQQGLPLYDEAIRQLGIGSGTDVLDVGCASGVFLRTAADRGAQVSGLDASEALIEIARSRVPEADLRVGDLQFLPHDDDTFDAVTSFNSFWFAADPVAALGEARRVAKPGGHVFLLVWGRPERCQLGAVLAALGALMPPSEQRSKFGLHEPGVLEEWATEAGLTPGRTGDLVSAFEFADQETLIRQIMSAASTVLATRAAGEAAVRAAILESMEPFRTPAGGYRVENEWRYLIATA